jgi:hypothetical protein
MTSGSGALDRVCAQTSTRNNQQEATVKVLQEVDLMIRKLIKMAIGGAVSASAVLLVTPAVAVPAEESNGGGWRDILDITATIVEGVVEDVSYSYDEAIGPRTNARLGQVIVHRGRLPKGMEQSVVLRPFGGYKPNGHRMIEVHTPLYTPGHRVVVFLRNEQWFDSPALESWVFRVIPANGKKLLVAQNGAALRKLGRYLPFLGEETVPRSVVDLPDHQLRLAPMAAQMLAAGSKPTLEVADLLREIDVALVYERKTLSGDFIAEPSTWSTGKWNLVPGSPDPGANACQPVPAEDLVCSEAKL